MVKEGIYKTPVYDKISAKQLKNNYFPNSIKALFTTVFFTLSTS